MYPQILGSVAGAPPRLPGGSRPLEPAAVAAHLTCRLGDDVRRLAQPTRRGVGVICTARRKDAARGRPYALSNVPALVADLVCDPRIPTDAICDVLAGQQLEVRALRGECQAAGDPWAAHQAETLAQGAADVAVGEALRTRAPGALLDAITALGRHEATVARVRLALRAEYDRVTCLTTA